MKRFLFWVGCVLASPLLLVLLAAYLLGLMAYTMLLGMLLRVAFFAKHGTAGKRGVLIYSNSPNWQGHIEQNWLPRLQDNLVIVNWSERERYFKNPTIAWRVFRHWAGEYDYNPMLITFKWVAFAKTVHFHRAFLNLKHGEPDDLALLEQTLFNLVER